MSDGQELTLGGRSLTPEDWLALGVVAGAIAACRSVKMDSRTGEIALVGVPAFGPTILAVEHLRKRAAGVEA